MIFSSAEFCFIFLPVVVGVFYLLQSLAAGEASKIWLILGSAFFYTWWSVWDASILAVLIALNYYFVRTIISRHNDGDQAAARRLRNIGVGLNILVLIAFKYTAFLLGIFRFNDLASSAGSIALPLGISFFTFQKIALLVDSEAQTIPLPTFRNFVLFVLFFPQLIAGPIVHHREMMPQLDRMNERPSRALDFAVGITQFSFGLAKKLILADGLSGFVGPIFRAASVGTPINMVEAWSAVFAYTLQIYFDFSGYSDMALGLARMFGVRLPLNFFSPYKAINIIEFWRRWHMTLSRFLRDYVYIPLGGNRHGARRRYLNLLMTMVVGGIWHGANWTFVVWGTLHGLALALTHLAQAGGVRFQALGVRIVSTTITLSFVTLAWVLFRADSLTSAGRIYAAMAGSNGLAPTRLLASKSLAPIFGFFDVSSGANFVLTGSDWLTVAFPRIAVAAAIALLAPNTHQILRRYGPALFGSFSAPPGKASALAWRPSVMWYLVTTALFAVSVFHMSNVSEFLYFQF